MSGQKRSNGMKNCKWIFYVPFLDDTYNFIPLLNAWILSKMEKVLSKTYLLVFDGELIYIVRFININTDNYFTIVMKTILFCLSV